MVMAVIRSFTYPFTLENGGLKLSEDYDVIRERILQVLETRPWERVMQPLYGTPDFVFNAYPSVAIVVERVRISLVTQIAGVTFEVSGDLAEDGMCSLTVNWAVDRVDQPPLQFRLRA
jgi:hypothetical protein